MQIVHNTSNGPITFGPVFDAEFLRVVFELQEEIKNLTTAENYTLADICFAPLSGPFSGPRKISQCTIQSIWGYWQDDMATFNKTSEDGTSNDDDEEDYNETSDDTLKDETSKDKISENKFVVNYLDHFKKCTQ